MKLNYIVIDFETEGETTYDRFCNPLDPNHFVVANAYKHQRGEAQVEYRTEGIPVSQMFDMIDLSEVNLMVGQNFKFDMLWCWKNEKFQDWLKGGGQIWDTLQAEYLLRGQQVDFGKHKNGMDLDTLALQYGGALKDTEVKQHYKDGGTTLGIPKEQLIAYAKDDVINTEIVFLEQLKRVKAKGMLPIVKVYNDHLLAVTEMEFNGMYINKDKAIERAAELELELGEVADKLVTLLRENSLWPQDLLPFKVGSPAHLKNLFYGGPAKVVIRQPVLDAEGNEVVFKTGKNVGEVKMRNEKSEIYIPGFGIPYQEKWDTKSKGKGTGREVLLEIKLLNRENKVLSEVIDTLIHYKKWDKVVGTYLYRKKGNVEKGLVPKIHPDLCIHSEYKTTKTATGRLASSKPNAQNIPPTILDIFESRYGKGGKIIEGDFSQLEVVIQAYVTQCVKMLEDVTNGVDFHCLRLGYAVEREYDEVYSLCNSDPDWKLKRKNAKTISFQKSYGAHTSKIAIETGLPEDTIIKVFEKEDERYPEVKAYTEQVMEQLSSSATELDERLEVRYNGHYYPHKTLKQRVGQHQTLTGKIYTFREKAVQTTRGVFQYWPGPNVMNYPIQGTAMDIVAMMVGKLFRYMIHHRDKGLMVNEIHDSAIMDVREQYAEMLAAKQKEIMESVSETFQEKLGLTFNAPIHVDVNIGTTWAEAK